MRHALLLGLALGACGPSGFDKPMQLGGRTVEPAVLNRGQELYNRFCATCHGYDGKGETAAGRQLDPRPADLSQGTFRRVATPGALPTDAELAQVITNGIPGTGMPAWAQLQGADLDAVIQYLKTFSTRWQTARPTPPENGGKGSMKALPADGTAARFRAAATGASHEGREPYALAPATAHPTR